LRATRWAEAGERCQRGVEEVGEGGGIREIGLGQLALGARQWQGLDAGVQRFVSGFHASKVSANGHADQL
jgi:hypothetical protein